MMRAQTWPRRSQVPEPMSGMRAPCASTAGTMIPTSARDARSVVPFRRVRGIDHAPVGFLEPVEFGHLSLVEGKIEYRKVGGEVVGIGRARDRADALLDEIAQRHLRRTLAM